MADETFKGMLMECTLERLRQLARELGVKGYSRLNKEDLVSLLLEKGDPALLGERLHGEKRETVSPAPAEIKMDIEKKEKRLSKIAIWASILGIPLGVIALVVALILSSSSDKQLEDVKTRIDKFDPLKVKEKDELLTEKEKRIKELEKAVAELCVGAPQERQEALAELKKGNMEKAIELLKKAISTQCGVVAADYYQLGIAYFVDKKPDYRAALAAFLEADRLTPGNGKYINMIGRAFHVLGGYSGAKEYYEKALVIDEKVYGKEHPNVARDLNNLGSAYWNLGDHRKAISYYEQALAIVRKTYGEQHPYVASTLNNLGGAYNSLGEFRKAISYYEQALAIDEKVLGKEHPDVAIRLNNLGAAYDDLGDHRKAISYYEQALTIDEKVYGKEHPDVARDFNNLGAAYFVMGRKDKAKSYFQNAYAIKLKFFGKDHPSSKTTKEWLDACK
jgi:tetratricopeptide (TPR) repeat protein